MNKSKLSAHELNTNVKLLEMKSQLSCEIMELKDESVLCLINGSFYCGVQYESYITYEEEHYLNGINDDSDTELFAVLNVDVDCETFKFLKGHSLPMHQDIICKKIEEEIYYQKTKNKDHA